MRELELILAEYDRLKMDGTGCVLATVVHVEGSSYRRAGARMLIDEFGNITGAISGGCLEGDALRKALLAWNQGKNKLITYDTSDEEDAVIGAQLGCNGIIQVLFEPQDYQNDKNSCELLKMAVLNEQPAAIAIVFSLDSSAPQKGTSLILAQTRKFLRENIPAELQSVIMKQARICLEQDIPYFGEANLGGSSLQFFIQNYRPPIKLVLVGAGNDAQILARQADLLGWRVIVTDGRPTHANSRRFGSSCQVIVSKPEDSLKDIAIDKQTFVVLMSHNYKYDLAVLKLLKEESQLAYIGILGPRKKYQRMLDDLEKEGVKPDERFLDRIYAPVGLEIGAETPAEIGLSILAEIQAVLTGKSARPLREKQAPIHDKTNNSFNKVKL
ncbi:XdhC family protein [Gramella sp. GC03-9]|uniref:XdhC family protein n=1 Tax=Christiangramia oceanisediminis TaxID=2920386 RepID=A0A9X2I3C6_9FLAO|nr:XdhC/CoxI family protein [Gramella oceanisediminis]MCP9199955.1 XdhC family protein [Gramella oceanisediminis]